MYRILHHLSARRRASSLLSVYRSAPIATSNSPATVRELLGRKDVSTSMIYARAATWRVWRAEPPGRLRSCRSVINDVAPSLARSGRTDRMACISPLRSRPPERVSLKTSFVSACHPEGALCEDFRSLRGAMPAFASRFIRREKALDAQLLECDVLRRAERRDGRKEAGMQLLPAEFDREDRGELVMALPCA